VFFRWSGVCVGGVVGGASRRRRRRRRRRKREGGRRGRRGGDVFFGVGTGGEGYIGGFELERTGTFL